MPESSPFSRRVFLAAGSAIGASLMVPRLPGVLPAEGEAHAAEHAHDLAADMAEPWKDFKPGAPFVEPEVRRSVNGELETTLRLQYAYKDVGGYRLFMRSYEGTIPGPTLRLKPGDVLRIKLINDLPPTAILHPPATRCRINSIRRTSMLMGCMSARAA